ncbi:MAG: GtrA family protein [Lachnospiraceae bacterium]|nr:GtrA family protein [Lachnospiraceae bacterium]
MAGDNEKRKEMIRMIKFVFFSISAGVIEIVSFTLLDLLTPWNYWPKYLIALVLSVIWNFTLNRAYTFQSANNVPVAMLKVAAFYAVFTPLSTILGNYFAETLHWNEYLVTGLNMICNFITEYIYDRYVVFGKTIDTNERAQRENGGNQNE